MMGMWGSHIINFVGIEGCLLEERAVEVLALIALGRKEREVAVVDIGG